VSGNKIFGEDNNRSFVRKFEFMAFYTLPREEKLWNKFGIAGMDQFSRRESGNWFRESVPLIIGTSLYGLSFLIWLYILSTNKLSFAYPMAISSTLILSAIGAKIFLNEGISFLNLLGFLLIAIAAFLVSK
jgi:drug/metabolite transporter (DMT)-like permease